MRESQSSHEVVSNEFNLDLALNVNEREIDGSLIDGKQQFLDYLNKKTLTIELIDADSLFVFGVAKLPLNYLELPGDSAIVQKALELDVCDL